MDTLDIPYITDTVGNACTDYIACTISGSETYTLFVLLSWFMLGVRGTCWTFILNYDIFLNLTSKCPEIDKTTIYIAFRFVMSFWHRIIIYSITKADVKLRHLFTPPDRIRRYVMTQFICHDGVIKWKVFRVTALCEGNRSPVDSLHKGQWRGALMFSLIFAWTNGWANVQDPDVLNRHGVHYDITAMGQWTQYSRLPLHMEFICLFVTR